MPPSGHSFINLLEDSYPRGLDDALLYTYKLALKWMYITIQWKMLLTVVQEVALYYLARKALITYGHGNVFTRSERASKFPISHIWERSYPLNKGFSVLFEWERKRHEKAIYFQA